MAREGLETPAKRRARSRRRSHSGHSRSARSPTPTPTRLWEERRREPDNRLSPMIGRDGKRDRSIRARLRARAPLYIPRRFLLSTFATHRRRLLIYDISRPIYALPDGQRSSTFRVSFFFFHPPARGIFSELIARSIDRRFISAAASFYG